MTQESHNDMNRSLSLQQQTDHEALSALLDGELSEFELRRLLDRLDQEPALLALWERMNLARSVLQPDPLRLPQSVAGQAAFAERVMQQVRSERLEHHRVELKKAAPSWLAPIGRLAIAASVAMAVFVGMQVSLQDGASSPAETQLADSASTLPDAQRQVAFDEEAQRRLNEYIRSVNIPARAETQSAPFNVLSESPLLRPVSDRELIGVGQPSVEEEN